MKLLRSTLDKTAPLFEKGGKLEKLYPAYEAGDTFLYTPGEVTDGPSHVRDGMDLKRMMTLVIVALIPAIFMACYNTGYQANRALVDDLAAEAVVDAPVLADEAAAALGGLTPEQVASLNAGELLGLSAEDFRTLPEDELAELTEPVRSVPTAALEADLLGEAEEPTEAAEASLAAALEARGAVDAVVAARQLETPEIENWRGWVMGLLGIGPDPGSFVSNFLHGLLWFLPVYIVTVAAGGTAEAIFSIVRGHEINEGFLVSSMLFPLTLPATIPLWQAALGILFGIVVAKEVFGGTGRNFLNPAMTSRAFLYFAYPADITGDKVWNAATGTSEAAYDAYTSATTLNTMSTRADGTTMPTLIAGGADFKGTDASWSDAFLGFIEGSMGETSFLAVAIGAAILIAVGVGSWRIMAGCLVGFLAFDTVLWLVGGNGLAYLGMSEEAGLTAYPMYNIPPWWHLVVGGFAFGAVFMATDPVSSTWTKQGHWYYGILIGVVTILIRVVNPAYPAGIMLAVLFGNVFAPLIDYFVVQGNIKRRLARSESFLAARDADLDDEADGATELGARSAAAQTAPAPA